MPHLLIAGKLHPTGEALLTDIAAQGISYDYVEEVTELAYIPRISTADALVIRTQPLRAETIAQAPQLAVVSRHGVGIDAIDLPALTARGIALTTTGEVNSVSVAEHAMLQLLSGFKQLIRADQAVRRPGQWGWRNLLEQHEISGKNLLILGYGRTGRNLARIAQGFSMRVRACDPYLEQSGWPAGPVQATSLQEGLAWADCISVHTPRGTRPTLGSEEIAQMKPGAVLANTSRGGVVDELALAEALQSGRISAAGIDVFAQEPPTDDSPLLECDNAILSPHIAGLTEECSERMAVRSICNALDFLNGTIDPQFIVNPEVVHG